MKNKLAAIIVTLGGMVAMAIQANAGIITYNFQENGSNKDLTPVSLFNESGFVLTASGFIGTTSTVGAATDLYAKNLGGDEIGLGLVRDPSGQNEITTDDFIQLTLPTVPATIATLVLAASVQAGESANVYFTMTPGSLVGATLLGTISGADGSLPIPAGDQTGFIDIQAGAGNVLLAGLTVTTPSVPDGGTTLMLLGSALGALGLARRFVWR